MELARSGDGQAVLDLPVPQPGTMTIVTPLFIEHETLGSLVLAATKFRRRHTSAFMGGTATAFS